MNVPVHITITRWIDWRFDFILFCDLLFCFRRKEIMARNVFLKHFFQNNKNISIIWEVFGWFKSWRQYTLLSILLGSAVTDSDEKLGNSFVTWLQPFRNLIKLVQKHYVLGSLPRVNWPARHDLNSVNWSLKAKNKKKKDFQNDPCKIWILRLLYVEHMGRTI